MNHYLPLALVLSWLALLAIWCVRLYLAAGRDYMRRR